MEYKMQVKSIRAHIHAPPILISYGIDVQIAWREYGISRPLIHVCLQRGTTMPNWRDPKLELEVSGIDVSKPCFSLLEALVKNTSCIEARDTRDFDCTPLIAAARSGLQQVLDLLLSRDANVNAVDERGFTALHGACVSVKTGIFLRLLKKRAKVDAITDEGLSPLHFLCLRINKRGYYNSFRIFNMLLGFGANPMLRAKLPENRSALETSIHRRQLEIANILFSKCPPITNEIDIWRLFNVYLSNLDPIYLGLILGADQHGILLQNSQCLLRLLQSERPTTDSAMMLLDKNIPCDGMSADDGNTVFWAARNQKGRDLIERLLADGTSPNIPYKTNSIWQCSLLEALKVKDIVSRRRYVELLINNGADIDLPLNATSSFTTFSYLIHSEVLIVSESVADILFCPRSLEKIPEARQIFYLNSTCRLTHVKLFRELSNSVSDTVTRKFTNQFAQALPVSRLVDVTEYAEKVNLTIEHMDAAVDVLGMLVDRGSSWTSECPDTKMRAVDVLEELTDTSPDDVPMKIAASWLLKKRISIISNDMNHTKVRLSTEWASDEYLKTRTLQQWGLALEILKSGEAESDFKSDSGSDSDSGSLF
ncbi:ankyrin repeat-containing domain protein [Hypoxylon trugodes]|uniref:ankyrin repeat-containing domain protein n=1 Tax=Hypoxylon trugodes TaxID=326681 RepID=UPI0021A0B88F|nr:ankyrin repeat-containing domain protein [Hypoxylon trugodes]KAI1392688.1 ankyrin repeat-containing domain protein [Hypoxylon trugodes]